MSKKNTLENSRKPIYSNCFMLSPSGEILCRCNDEKADWYLNKNLADLEKENPKTIRLKFEPSGCGKKDDLFYLQEMKNRCVVCGCDENLSKHHVVPYCFRRYFPENIKRHNSHDILLMCRLCHDKYEKIAYNLKLELSKKYKCSMRGCGFVIDENLRKIKKSAIELSKNKCSEKERDSYINIIRIYLGKESISKEDLNGILKDVKIEVKSSSFVPFGKFIVNSFSSLEEFVIMWRQDFVKTMCPKFLPDYWDINRK